MSLISRLLACFHRPQPKRQPRARFLFPQEWGRLKMALDQQPDKVRIYFSLLILEGPRMSELREAQWAHVDLTPGQGLWYKPTTKTGRPHVLPLSESAVLLLSQLPHTGRFCFLGETPDGPWSRTAVQYWWRKIRAHANCQDVQIRDLRRTAASWMVQEGENLKVIQSMLNHSNIQMTGRVYAHLDQNSLRAALNRHAERVWRLAPASTLSTPCTVETAPSQGHAPTVSVGSSSEAWC